MSDITANDLKTKGISSLESALDQADEAVIRVRGKPRFVVMNVDRFEQLRDAEMLFAWHEARIASTCGEFVVETARSHIARLRQDEAVLASYTGRGRNSP